MASIALSLSLSFARFAPVASGWGQGELVGARLRLIKRQRGVHSVEEERAHL